MNSKRNYRIVKSVMVWAAVFFLIIVIMPDAQAADTKGIRRVIKDRAGKPVGLYKNSYALVIGASRYLYWPRLESVPYEVENVVEALDSQGFFVKKVIDPDAENLKDAFDNFIDKYGFDEKNRLLFFFSGHGHSRKKGKKGYLVPVDAPDPGKSKKAEKEFLKKAVGMNQVLTWARRIEAGHAMFVFDSCFSGTVFKAKKLPEHPPHISDITSKPVRQFISAGSAGESVPAKSVFTPSFVRAINGEGDLNRDGYVTGTEMGMFLHDRVLHYQTGQTPQYGKIRDPDLDEGDFVFFTQPLPLPPKDTKLKVIVDVPGAWVWLNGENYTNARTFKISQAGLYRVKVTADGYQSFEQSVRIQPGQDVPPVLADLTKIVVSKPLVVAVAPVTSVTQVSTSTGPVPGRNYTDPELGMEFVWVKNGCYQMGCGSWAGDCEDDEKPEHRVCVDGFWIGKYEVTRGQWKEFVSDDGYGGDGEDGYGCSGGMGNPNFSQADNHPVACVSWKEVSAFANWLSDKTGNNFRLPTEAEWEYAARSGGKKQKYAGFSNDRDLFRYGNFCDKNCEFSWKEKSQNDGYEKTAPAGNFKPNGLGIYDMSGNVWEWCSDWYGDKYYKGSPKSNPGGPASGRYRVDRGGGGSYGAASCRSASRGYYSPGRRYYYLGFRLALSPQVSR
ncbi:SUMF1/EgtB/PvdO family nonheme iron enzyme [Desulfobacterales bacterium HSG16]|nr:SUMF1/EgtB/PvdO family nonheme iron enzyme [Desulfobacterales bacterium HSG16]